MSFSGSTLPKVKICGLNEATALHAAINAGADWVGFVFFKRSPRYVSAHDAHMIWEQALEKKTVSHFPQRVGLFVKPTVDEITTVLQNCTLDILQLYGVSEQEAASIRQITQKPVWVSYGIQERGDLPVSTLNDGLVIEAAQQAHETRPGGNGQRIDWSLLAEWEAPAPWLLAGGLTPENVTEAITQSQALAVDVSSGVEKTPGVKDVNLIIDFIANVKSLHL